MERIKVGGIDVELETRECAGGCGLSFKVMKNSPIVFARRNCDVHCKGEKRSQKQMKEEHRIASHPAAPVDKFGMLLRESREERIVKEREARKARAAEARKKKEQAAKKSKSLVKSKEVKTSLKGDDINLLKSLLATLKAHESWFRTVDLMLLDPEQLDSLHDCITGFHLRLKKYKRDRKKIRK